MNEHFIKKLMSTMKCGICGESYEIDNIKVLGRSDDTWFLSAKCSACDSEAMVAAVIKKNKPPEIVSDLTKTETVKFAQADTIDVDDVLDLHDFLNNFDGDFSNLFNQIDRTAT